MNDPLLLHYGLSDPYAELWQDNDQTVQPSTTASQNEPDALGTGHRILGTLLERGITTNGAGIPPQYSLSSKQFNARDYIREVHRKASPADLKRGQEYLNHAIESRSGSLKTLVESNYDRFVGSKRIIDNVYAQAGAELLKKDKSSRIEAAKDTLNESRAKAAQIFEPVIENRRRADRLRGTLGILEQYESHFELPSILLKCREKNDKDGLLREYKRGQNIFRDILKPTASNMTPVERRNRRVLQRVWAEVEQIMSSYEDEVWQQIDERAQVDSQTVSKLANILLELGVDTNPYFKAFTQQAAHIKQTTLTTLETGRIQIEVLRRNLVAELVSTRQQNIDNLQSFVTTELSPSESEPNIIEKQQVIAFWSNIEQFVADVWTSQIAATTELWKVVQEMTDRRTTKLLPAGPDGRSKRFHIFTSEEQEEAIRIADNLVQLLCDSIADFFLNKPTDQLPAVYSPVTDKHPQAETKQRAEFAFLPPSSNALGCAMHLNRLMTKIMDGSDDLHSLQISSRSTESIRLMTASIRERMIRAVCELWQTDCDDLVMLENWIKASEQNEGTMLPKTFYVFQRAVLSGINKITFAEGTRPVTSGVMPPPSNRLLQNIRQQFVKNVYQTINGLVLTTFSTDDGRDLDTKRVLSMTNITEIQKTTLARLVQQFENSFQCSISEDMNKLQSMFTQFDQKLFTSYTKPRTNNLDNTIKSGLSNTSWLTMSLPQEIDAYVFDLVLQVVVTHAHLSKCAPTLRQRILTYLIEHIFTTLKSIILSIPTKFGIGAMLKITLDLEFLSITFTPAYLSPESTSTMEEIFSNVESRVDRNYPLDGGHAQPDMKKILSRARRGIASQTKVFKS